MSKSILPQLTTDKNGLTSFQFGDLSIRAGVLPDGTPFAVARDVADVLGLGNVRQALTRLDDDEKGVILTDTPGGRQNVSVVNQFGLYALIMTSRKPIAKAFKRWVIHELIPAVMEHGGYVSPNITADQIAALRSQLELKDRQLADLSHAMYKWVMPTHAALTAKDDD